MLWRKALPAEAGTPYFSHFAIYPVPGPVFRSSHAQGSFRFAGVISEKPWRPEAVTMLLAGFLVIGSLGTIGASLLQGKDTPPRFVAFVVSTLLGQGLACVLVHFFLRYHRMKWREFLGIYQRRVVMLMLLGILTAVIVMPMGWFAAKLSSDIITRLYEQPKQQIVVEVLESATDPGQRIVFALAAIVMAPLIEETIFRGILYPFLKQQGYRRLAFWGTCLLFAAIHMDLARFLPLLLLAIVLTALYEWTDAMIAPITAHAAFNAINFILLLNHSKIERWLDPHP
jgi:membrane protease YdiL (CAAX protease family)